MLQRSTPATPTPSPQGGGEARVPAAEARPGSLRNDLWILAPGIALAAAVAVAAVLAAPVVARAFPVPAMVIALLAGIALNRLATRPAFQPGLAFAVKKLLRWAVALLGLRIALGDVAALGPGAAAVVVAGMAATVLAGFWFARLFGQNEPYGALAGAATAGCGASATLATATVVPAYYGKEADIAFVVVAVNALSTAAMVLYPPLCAALGLDERTTGIMLGATIHDVAQVVGAGYAVSEPVGNTAVVVKLFRVFLLLPVVLAVGWWFTRKGVEHGEARVPVPVFALVFLALCLLNSAAPYAPALAPLYVPAKAALVEASTWGLLVAIAALGLGTSVTAVARLGWRHVATVTATTLVILVAATGGLMLVR
ncbi:MAG TPA: putative sulfate exporter family transporter [Beijerinckiaceae bacterium]